VHFANLATHCDPPPNPASIVSGIQNAGSREALEVAELLSKCCQVRVHMAKNRHAYKKRLYTRVIREWRISDGKQC